MAHGALLGTVLGLSMQWKEKRWWVGTARGTAEVFLGEAAPAAASAGRAAQAVAMIETETSPALLDSGSAYRRHAVAETAPCKHSRKLSEMMAGWLAA